MYDAYMPNVNLSRAQLCTVDLSYAYLYSAPSETTSLESAQLTFADLSNAIGYEVDLTASAKRDTPKRLVTSADTRWRSASWSRRTSRSQHLHPQHRATG